MTPMDETLGNIKQNSPRVAYTIAEAELPGGCKNLDPEVRLIFAGCLFYFTTSACYISMLDLTTQSHQRKEIIYCNQQKQFLVIGSQ